MREKIRFLISDNLRWYALVLGLAAVLVFLALLQYRSSRQVSDATTEQMRASLQGSLMDLRQGVERELAPLCREFQLDVEVPRGTAQQEYASRLERWRHAAAHPGLVNEIYVWREIDGDSPEFLTLNGKREIATTDWRVEFGPLRQRLWQLSPKSQGHMIGGNADPQRRPANNHAPPAPVRPSFPWMIDESIPALVHPVLEGETNLPGAKRPPVLTWIVIRLNVEVLGQHIFPELAQRYFGKDSASAYRLAVTEYGAVTRVLYSSDGKFGNLGDMTTDASLNLFGPPVSMVGRQHLPFERMFGFVGSPHSAPANGPGPQGPSFGEHEGPFHIDPIRYSPGERGWTVLARHREGSVEAAVAASYRRNLIINFGVLVLLAATMGLIIVTSLRARRLAQAQIEFVAGVSHELRTPLTGIVSAAQNIADGVVDTKEKMARYGAAIQGQAQQLTELIEQILLFSAMEKDRHRYHLQLADIAEVVDAGVKSTASLCRSAGFTVQRKIQPDLPSVMVDVMALTHCLQNLITNSVKYSGTSRWIGVEASITTDAYREKEILIAVEDRGLGMDAKELKRIFEPFYRSPAVTAAQIRGSGLGLPLTKTMVEAMGGKLMVTSEPGKGSRFTIHLPVPESGSSPSAALDADFPT